MPTNTEEIHLSNQILLIRNSPGNYTVKEDSAVGAIPSQNSDDDNRLFACTAGVSAYKSVQDAIDAGYDWITLIRPAPLILLTIPLKRRIVIDVNGMEFAAGITPDKKASRLILDFHGDRIFLIAR